MAEEAQEQETQQPAVQSTMSAAPKQLAATDILSKMQAGTPILQGEKLPDVPKGMSAKGFYGQFPGGAAVYSQAPFKQPTYGQVTTPTTTTPTAPVSPPADTTPVDTAPVVEEAEENLSGGPTAEDIALDEAVAESTTDTQVNDLFNLDIDSGYTFDYDPDLTLTENIANEYEDFKLALTADISSVTDGTVVLNNIDKTLTNIGDSLNTAYNNALEEGEDALLSFMDDTKSILDDLETYAANPETIATDSFNYVTEALTEFYDNLSLMTQPDHPDFDLALEQLVSGATKALMGSALGTILGVPVLGTLIVELITTSDFFSDAMLGHPGQYETVTYHPETHTWTAVYTPTHIAYFDINGIARDINGKEVLTGRGGIATSGPTHVIPGKRISAAPTRFEKLPDVIRDVEGGGFHNVYDQYNPGTDYTPGTTAADQEAALAEGDDTSGGGYVEDIDQRYGGATNIGPPEVGPTDTKIDPATIPDFTVSETTDPGVGYVDTFGDAPFSPPDADTPSGIEQEGQTPSGISMSVDDIPDEETDSGVTPSGISMSVDDIPDEETDSSGNVDIGIGTVDTTSPGISVSFTDAEIALAASIVDAEAGGEKQAGKDAVAQVMVNRVVSEESNWKGKTPTQILTEPYAFAKPSKNPPSTAAIEAVKAAIEKGGKKDGHVFFLNPELTVSIYGHKSLHTAISNYFDPKTGKQIASIPPEIAIRQGKHLLSKYYSLKDVPKHLQETPEQIRKRGEEEKQLSDDIANDLFTDMPLDEDPTIDEPPEDYDLSIGDTGFDDTMERGAGDPLGYDDTMGGSADSDSSGEAGDDSGKIICTMMNRMYGMGDYRIKQWLFYSDRHLTAEHQLGYHKLYCKLVSMMPSNKIVAKILSHMAEKRTDDIVAEMKHTKRSWLGRTYRTLLIDKPSYMVGWMIKRNWLQPADISILNKGNV